MAWTPPKTWTPGELVTAANMNVHVRDNLTNLDSRLTTAGLTTLTANDTAVANSATSADQILFTTYIGVGTPNLLTNVGDTIAFRVAGRFGVGGANSRAWVLIATSYPSAIIYNHIANEHWLLDLTLTKIAAGQHRLMSMALAGTGVGGATGNTTTVRTDEIAFNESVGVALMVMAYSTAVANVIYEASWIHNLR